MPFFSEATSPIPAWEMYYDINITSSKTPVFLFIHGFLEDSSMWKYLIDELKCNYLIIDVPGHGKSKSIKKSYFIEDLAEFILYFLDRKAISKVEIIGHSMGGYIGLEILEKAKDKINSILLVHSTADSDNETKKIERRRSIDLARQDKKRYIHFAVQGLFPAQFSNLETIKSQGKRAENTSTDGIIESIRAMKNRRNHLDTLKNFKGKIGYIIGKEDPLLSCRKIQEEATSVKASIIYTLEKVGHMSHVESPNALVSSVRNWKSLISDHTQD